MKPLVLLAILFFITSAVDAEPVADLMNQGLALMKSGDPLGARKAFEQIIEQNPKHGPARLLLGQIALEQGAWQQAKNHLEIAVQSNPQRLQLAWELLGNATLFLKDPAKALQCYEKSLVLEPGFVPAAIGRAKVMILQKDLDHALIELQKLESPDAELLHAELLIYLNRAVEARQVLERLAANTDTARLLLIAISDDPSAETKLRIALGNSLAVPAAYAALGIRLRSAPASEVLFRIASEIGFDPAWSLFLTHKNEDIRIMPPVIQQVERVQRLAKDNPEESNRILRELLSQRPFHVPALLMQADSFEKAGSPWEALLLYRKLLEWLPDIPSIQARLANLARTMGALALAECTSRKALRVNPGDAGLHYLLAAILYDAEKNDEAVTQCLKAMDLGLRDAAVYVTLGNLYYRKTQIPEAIQALEKAVELDPRSAESVASFALSELAGADPVKLRGLLEKAVEANPENVNSLYSLGVVYLQGSELQKGKQVFSRLEQLAPGKSQTAYNLSLIYARLGEQQEAEKAMTRFRQLKDVEDRDWEKQNQAHRIRLQADEAREKEDCPQAIRLYARLASDGTADRKDFLHLANCYLQLSDFVNAGSAFEALLKSPPYELEVIKGMIAAAKGSNKTETMNLWQERLDALRCD